MILVFDIGNTHTVVGVFQKGKLAFKRRMASSLHRTEDEIWVLVKEYCALESLSASAIQGAIIASVVPLLTDVTYRAVEKYLTFKPIVVSGSIDVGFAIPYKDPSQLGADRICAVAGALKKFGGPAIVVDFGTATTYDVISSKGEYLGGVIAPGIRTSAANLAEKTALLSKASFQFPAQVIGISTKDAIQSGVMYYALDGFEGMIRRLRRVAGKYAMVIATGGLAPFIAEMTNEIKYLEPNIVLEGARIIYEKIGKKSKK
jgi:type III pantothenate kinase